LVSTLFTPYVVEFRFIPFAHIGIRVLCDWATLNRQLPTDNVLQ